MEKCSCTPPRVKAILARLNNVKGDKHKAWEALEKAIQLVGAASELPDVPADLRGKLINALAGLVLAAQRLRCPACGCWLEKGGEQ
jgi:hypothetical protein